jgi:hypothetical protein
MESIENRRGRRTVRCYSVTGELPACSTSVAALPTVFYHSRVCWHAAASTNTSAGGGPRSLHDALISLGQSSPLLSPSLGPPLSSRCVGKFIIVTPHSPNCSHNQHRNSFAHRLSYPTPSLLARAAQSPSSSSWLLSAPLWSSCYLGEPLSAPEPHIMLSCALAPP